MRIVVVGTGVIGLLTAMECVRAGAQVELVDRDDIPSPRATSHDRQRVVRALHRGDAALTRAAARAEASWRDVERRAGARFYHRIGSLTAMPAEEVAASLALLGSAAPALSQESARALSPGELAVRYPQIRFPAGLAAVAEPAAGVVLADRALAALARWLRAHPAVRSYPRRRVTEVGEAGTVRLADRTVLAGDRVVVAAGPWSRDLLPAALGDKLTLYRQSVLCYLPRPSWAAWACLPAIPAIGTEHGAWLMPPVADTRVRLSAASACRAVAEITDRVTPWHRRAQLVDHFSGLLAGFDPAAVTGATDGYYLAAGTGRGPLLAASGDGTVWAYAACGGMSFKLAPLIASTIADRALGRPPRPTGLDSIDQPRQLAAGKELAS
jgi:glycine/D-amino acid oxidase-like deaminating enzyme